jgi:hypothetical protein
VKKQIKNLRKLESQNLRMLQQIAKEQWDETDVLYYPAPNKNNFLKKTDLLNPEIEVDRSKYSIPDLPEGMVESPVDDLKHRLVKQEARFDSVSVEYV